MVDTVTVTVVYSDAQEGVDVDSVGSCTFFFESVVGPSMTHKSYILLQPSSL